MTGTGHQKRAKCMQMLLLKDAKIMLHEQGLRAQTDQTPLGGNTPNWAGASHNLAAGHIACRSRRSQQCGGKIHQRLHWQAKHEARPAVSTVGCELGGAHCPTSFNAEHGTGQAGAPVRSFKAEDVHSAVRAAGTQQCRFDAWSTEGQRMNCCRCCPSPECEGLGSLVDRAAPQPCVQATGTEKLCSASFQLGSSG